MDFRQEMDAIREASFGTRYQRIRTALNEQASEERKKEFRELEDALFFLVAYIVANQDKNGWWNYGNPYYKVLTAHAVRQLHRMGLTLRSRWNLQGRNGSKDFEQGNLFLSTEKLLKCFRKQPTKRKHSLWEEDIWDDCWILLALFEVKPDFEDEEIQKWHPHINDEFDTAYRTSLEWLQKQFNEDGFNQKVERAVWYGPAHYAAAIELFDHPLVKQDFSQAKQNVEMLASAVKPMLEQSPNSRKWNDLFAWHVGQFLVTWRERPEHPALKPLDDLMNSLFEELKARQDTKDGFWGVKVSKETEKVYNTVRALAAFYVCTEDDDLLNSTNIKVAHKYLLDVARNNAGPIEDVKGSLNTLEGLQKLFDFRIRDIFPNVLMTVATRLNGYGIMDNILNPLESDPDTLKEIRASARKRLEEHGKSGLELLGVNDRLFQSLKGKHEFLKEFTGDRRRTPSETEREAIRTELRRFLSATLTETRSKSSGRLIKALWQTDGFLSFIPLIEHLSELEQDGAFYKYYRDHLNHEVLLFLLGAYIYYNCAAFRGPVNDEILRIYDKQNIPFDSRKLEGEFLFRWKLISTFHDIGYLFEVDPIEDKSTRTFRTKADLLVSSFTVVDKFRKNFLFDYFNQYVQASPQPTLSSKDVETAREKEIRDLADEIGKGLKHYDEVVEKKENLFELSTVDGEYRNAFKLISRHVKPDFIGGDLIEDYFKLCDVTPVSKVDDSREVKRTPFLDHGIMSALILLKAADIQRYYVTDQKEFCWSLFGLPKVSEHA
jgi:hypothetical protein